MRISQSQVTPCAASGGSTSPGRDGTLELVGLFGQLAVDGFGLVFLSLLGSKALCDGERIHGQRSD